MARHFLALISGALFLMACERAINIRPSGSIQALVVEARIESGTYPVVVLSRSTSYFDRLSLEELSNSFVHDAEVIFRYGAQRWTLREYAQPIGEGYHMYYYSIDSSGPTAGARGQAGRSYHLEITLDGDQYTASTRIPLLEKKIQSLYYERRLDPEDSTRVVLYARVEDPPGLGHYTRYFTRVNSGPFLPGLNSVSDDQILDGTTYTAQVARGVDRNQPLDEDDYGFFNAGDTVTLKYCNIDREVYDFWRTVEYNHASVGNPFSSPTRIRGNISNGALGYFGGYAVQYLSLIIPE